MGTFSWPKLGTLRWPLTAIWLVVGFLFLNAWLFGPYGGPYAYIITALALVLTALIFSQGRPWIVGIGAVLGALVCWWILSSLAMSRALRFEHALLAEFAVSTLDEPRVSVGRRRLLP